MMQIDGMNFFDASTLTQAAWTRVNEGLFRRIGRDEDEPALAFLGPLSWSRSDWHPAIDATLIDLAQRSDVGAKAVADFFATASSGACHLQVLNALCEQGWRAQTSDLNWHLAGEGSVDQDALKMALDTPKGPWRIVFDKPPKKSFDGSTLQGRSDAVANAVQVGRRRMSVHTDPCVLGFLRVRALFHPELRPEIGHHIESLWTGDDPRGWFCALEYLAVAHDIVWLSDIVQAVTAELAPGSSSDRSELRFRADEPSLWPRGKKRPWPTLSVTLGPQPSFAQVGALIGQRINHLNQSAPRA